MPSHNGFFVQLIAKIVYTCSTDIFNCGVRVEKYSLSECHCGENQVISRHNDVKHLYEIGRKSAKLILKSQTSTLKNAKIITLHKILKKKKCNSSNTEVSKKRLQEMDAKKTHNWCSKIF